MTIILLTFFTYLVIGIPVSFAISLSSVSYILITGAFPLSTSVQRMAVAVESWPLLAVPLFILVGNLVTWGTMGTRLLGLCDKLVGHIRGGLAHVSIVVSMFFAGVSGSSVADAASIGAILIPEMDKKGYDTPFSVAINATSSTIGIIIPPSIPLIVFAWMTNNSVRALFLGGVVPGILIGLTLMLVTYIIAKKRGYPKRKRSTLKEVWAEFKSNFLVILIPVVILGSILGGIMTTTESAVSGIVYVIFLQLFVYKEMKIKDIFHVFCESARSTGVIVFVISGSMLMSFILTYEGIPQMIARGILTITDNRIVIVLMMNIVFLFMGTILDVVPNITIFTPIFYPVAMQLGLSPIQFGVMMTVNLALGLFTPPVGQTLYVSCIIGKIPILRGAYACIPFLLGMLAVLFAIVLMPALTTFLPNLVFGTIR